MENDNLIILNETEYGVLLGNTLNNFATKRNINAEKVKIVKTIFIPSYDDETLEVRSTSNTLEQRYRTKIMLDDVEFLDEPDRNAVTIIGSDSRKYYLKRIPLNRIDVKVSCSCLDFYYRFAKWNHNDDALIGDPPPPYIKKTNRPPVNPAKVSGVCKHLIKLTNQLIAQRLFK